MLVLFLYKRPASKKHQDYRAVAIAIRFGVVRLVVHAQERYTLGESGLQD